VLCASNRSIFYRAGSVLSGAIDNVSFLSVTPGLTILLILLSPSFQAGATLLGCQFRHATQGAYRRDDYSQAQVFVQEVLVDPTRLNVLQMVPPSFAVVCSESLVSTLPPMVQDLRSHCTSLQVQISKPMA